MNIKTKISNIIQYAGQDKERYLDVYDRIKVKNYNALRKISFLGSSLLLLLSLVSFFVPSLSKNRILYVSFCLLFTAMYMAARFFFKEHLKYATLGCYGILFLSFIFGIILGVPLQPNTQATTFCVLLFALPLLIVDQPYRVSILLIIVSTIFCVASKKIKPPAVSSLDMVNTLSFLFLGISVNYFVMKTKASELVNSAIVEKDRDTDDLTHLMTKAAAMREIKREMAHNNPSALLVIDIDNFKQINDQLGHAYGDAVLRLMGECIRTVFRVDDILARFGGDEFIIFLPNLSDEDTVRQRVEHLVDEMNKNLTLAEHVYTVTGSIGIAFFPENGADYDTLFENADKALYTSKGKGKNCYTFYLDANLNSPK